MNFKIFIGGGFNLIINDYNTTTVDLTNYPTYDEVSLLIEDAVGGIKGVQVLINISANWSYTYSSYASKAVYTYQLPKIPSYILLTQSVQSLGCQYNYSGGSSYAYASIPAYTDVKIYPGQSYSAGGSAGQGSNGANLTISLSETGLLTFTYMIYASTAVGAGTSSVYGTVSSNATCLYYY